MVKPEDVSYEIDRIYEFLEGLKKLTKETGLIVASGTKGTLIASASTRRAIATELTWKGSFDCYGVNYGVHISEDSQRQETLKGEEALQSMQSSV